MTTLQPHDAPGSLRLVGIPVHDAPRIDLAAYRAILDAIGQMAWVNAPDGSLRFFNRFGVAYLGADNDALAGQRWIEHLHPDDRVAVAAVRNAAILAGRAYVVDGRFRRHDGDYRWQRFDVQPVRAGDGRLEGWIGSARDVQDEVERREELERLAASERAARLEAQRANEAKSAFLAMMSHDLRTPINATLGYVDLMTMGLRGTLVPEQRHDLERIRQSQRMLLALVNEVLEYTRIESGRLEVRREPVSLAELVADVAAVIEPLAEAKGLAFATSTVPRVTVLADRDRVRQVLLNLLGNAVKFTTIGHVRLTSAACGGRVALRVEDTGRGIAPERLARVFDPFVQGSPADAAGREGVGLGLAIARELAQAMGGDVECASEVGVGSVFTLTLPLKA